MPMHMRRWMRRLARFATSVLEVPHLAVPSNRQHAATIAPTTGQERPAAQRTPGRYTYVPCANVCQEMLSQSRFDGLHVAIWYCVRILMLLVRTALGSRATG